MAFKFVAKASTAALSAGVYPGELVSIEEFDSQFGESLKWHFVAFVDEDEVEVTAVTSMKFSTEAHARKYAEAILRRTFKTGEELDPAKLYSVPCRLVVSVKTLDNGNTVNRIEQVLPAVQPGPVLDGEPMDDDDVPF